MLRRTSCRLLRELPSTSHKPAPYTGPDAATVIAQRAKFLHPCHKHAFTSPLIINEGHMQYVWDHAGKRYLDCFGGVCTIAAGHSHPKVVEAVQKQVALLSHTTPLYLTPITFEFMSAINELLPKGEEWSFHFTNSGSEATDFAMLMARCYTKNSHIVSLRNGYHGMSEGSRGTVGVAGWKHATGSPGNIIRALAPIEYRGVYGDNVDKYVDDLKDVINIETPNAVAGFIAESIQGVGGLYPLLPGYLPKAYEVVRAAGGVCISDEVQCGWGRLGSHFWGFEKNGVVPDIITCAKSIANGAPMGLVIAKRKIAESIKDVAFFNTYGGNPISCAAALANLRVIESGGYQERCRVVGGHNISNLQALAKKQPLIGSVRGAGMMVGIELVVDRETKAPLSAAQMGKVLDELRERSVIVGKGGKHGNVIRMQGPMCATIDDMDYFSEALEEVLAKL